MPRSQSAIPSTPVAVPGPIPSTLQSMWAGVVLAEPGTGRVIFMNPAARGVFGLAADEPLGGTVDALLPELRSRWDAGAGLDVAGRVPGLLRGVRVDGTELRLSVSLFAYHMGPSLPPAMLAVIHGEGEQPMPLGRQHVAAAGQGLRDQVFRASRAA